jgi:hypothetical protein
VPAGNTPGGDHVKVFKVRNPAVVLAQVYPAKKRFRQLPGGKIRYQHDISFVTVIQLPLPFTVNKTHKEFCMKKLLLLLVPALFLSGCVSIKSPVMLDKSFPSAEKYEILGEAAIRGRQYFLPFALTWWGGVDWDDLRNEANRKFGNLVDDVVSVSVDTKVNSVFGIFVWSDITMRGTAIRYIRYNSRRARRAEG